MLEVGSELSLLDCFIISAEVKGDKAKVEYRF